METNSGMDFRQGGCGGHLQGGERFSKPFTYVFLAVLGLHCWVPASLAALSSGCSQAPVCRLVIAVASLVAGHGLRSCGAWAKLPHGMWNAPRAGLEPTSPALAGGFLTTGPPEKS